MRAARVVAFLVSAALLAAGLLAGCSEGAHRPTATSATSAASASASASAGSASDSAGAATAGAPEPPQCRTATCVSAQSVAVPGGYTVTLWHAGTAGDFTTRPVIELSRGSSAVQWLVASDGYGWDGALKCSAGPTHPSCLLIDGEGAHSALAQAIVVDGGRMSTAASVSSDSATIVATDLDHDGDLDVISLDSDFTPNYATGHLFWRTYRFAGTTLTSTGCGPAANAKEPPPTHFLTGACVRR